MSQSKSQPGWRVAGGRFPGSVLALLVLTTCLLGGCAMLSRPDLTRLYAGSQAATDQPPVILIPGIMGSRLADDRGKEAWVGSTWKLVFSDFNRLALPITGVVNPPLRTLHPTSLTDKLAGRDFYASITRVLRQAGGYTLARPGTAVAKGQRSYYEFAYDWREDNVHSARKLGELIDQIRIDHDDPDLQVDIIAHSMGGLITRYFLRYGGTDVLDGNALERNYSGAGRVRRVALLGTPNLGSVGSLHAFLVGERVGMGKISTAALSTFPSVYQLFPHPLNTWVVTADGHPLDLDLFDPALWRRFNWSIFNPKAKAKLLSQFADAEEGLAYYQALIRNFDRQLERARRFVWSLTVPLERSPWDIRVFGGDCTLTPARIVVEEDRDDWVVRLRPGDIKWPLPGIDYGKLMLEPGDGKVTKASLLARESLDPAVPRHRYSYFPVDGEMFLCEGHAQLSTNITFQDNLLQYLLNRDPVIDTQ